MLVEIGGTFIHPLQIGEIFEFLTEAGRSDYLIVGGLIFLFISIAGNISGKLEPGKTGRIVGGVVGTVLLATGLVLSGGFGPGESSTPTPTVDTVPPTTASQGPSGPTTTVPSSPIPPTTTSSVSGQGSSTTSPPVTTTTSITSIRTDVGGVNAPVTVFLGEEGLDVSDVIAGNGNPIGMGSVVLIGESGEADGDSTTIDGDDADFTESNGFVTGGYRLSTSPNDRKDFSVREARVTDLTLEDAATGSDITGGSVSKDQVVIVRADFNFESAAYVEVTVEDPDGLDVTSELLSERTTIQKSSGSLRLDFPGSDLDAGTYTVTVEGPEDSTDLSYASRSATLVLR